MTDKQRTWINAIIGLAAVAIVIWLSPSPDYQAHGILLPAQQTRSAISPDSVIQIANRPISAKLMGHINIERHYPSTNQKAQRQIGKLAQKLAAQVGANAIVVNSFRLGAVTRTRYIYVFQGTAYYAPLVKSTLEFSS